ncbi:hypothetical protein AaE_008520, partial [Aphanomyces astaci]
MKWLHWLNSLPLASCLLVDSFAVLQNGDVLFEVANALQTLQPPPAKALATAQSAHKIQQVLAVVLPHVPKHSSSHHHVLRDPESVLDILEGQIPAICATLSILKTLWMQKHIRRLQQQYIHGQVDKLHRNVPQTPPPERPPTTRVKTTVAVSYPTPTTRLVPKVFRPPGLAWNT